MSEARDSGLARQDATAEAVRDFVVAAVAAQGLALPDDAIDRVAEVFARNAQIAARVIGLVLPEASDPAALFRLD
ncbi:MAG: AtzG-like protein [Betaproteobacteria bacterium]|jgi:hypothetical protein